MPLAAFILGLLSLIVASLALGWNIYAWHRSIGRARCEVTVASGFDEECVERIIRVPAKGHTEFVGVEVHNVGRAPLVVRDYYVVPDEPPQGRLSRFKSIISREPTFKFRVGITWRRWRFGPDLPFSIDPGTFATWWTPRSKLDEAYSDIPETTDVRIRVVMADGREVVTENVYRLPRPVADEIPVSDDASPDTAGG
ncbi:hypothetical protein ABT304_05815 [Nocardioides sp. NPDC000445]|uniref:hypothetical protein n=1 Tax=Nocardioides sp. NPDC000445 TaxID=3154257 RepID=UPI00331DE472